MRDVNAPDIDESQAAEEVQPAQGRGIMHEDCIAMGSSIQSTAHESEALEHGRFCDASLNEGVDESTDSRGVHVM